MIQRCTNSKNAKYALYGGRGITVAPEWMADYRAFFSHIGPRPSPRHSIDRIDTNQGYRPGNVRWATAREQAQNMRTNRILTIGGVSLCVEAWAQRTGVNGKRIHARLKAGYSPEVSISVGPLENPQLKLKDADLSEIVRRISSGESQNAVARAFGVAQRSVARLLKRNGMEAVS